MCHDIQEFDPWCFGLRDTGIENPEFRAPVSEHPEGLQDPKGKLKFTNEVLERISLDVNLIKI